MSEVDPESALELRTAIFSRAAWQYPLPESAKQSLLGFGLIDSGNVDLSQLPQETMGRLGVTQTDQEGHFDIAFGRKLAPRPAQSEQSAFEEFGADSAFMRVTRVGGNIAIGAYYYVSAAEAYEPGQPPLCDAKLKIEDKTLLYRLLDELSNSEQVLDFTRATHLDPATGGQNPDKAPHSSETEVIDYLRRQLTEQDLQRAAQLEEEDDIRRGIRVFEQLLHPLGSDEVRSLARLAATLPTTPY